MTERVKNHFEKMVEELVKEKGPLSSQQIARLLAEEEKLIVVNSPNSVRHHDDDGVVIYTDEQSLRAVSVRSVEARLHKAWFLYQDDAGRWHLGS